MIKNQNYKDTIKAHHANIKNSIDKTYFFLLENKQYNEVYELIKDQAIFWGYTKFINNRAVSEFGSVKSLDLETYDDKGNIIPLSHRFDIEKHDYR